MKLESFRAFFEAIYNLILYVFKNETGWDGTTDAE